MSNIEDFYGIRNESGGIDVLYAEDGFPVTRMDLDGLYPVGSSLSARHEHAGGITITAEDAGRIGLFVQE